VQSIPGWDPEADVTTPTAQVTVDGTALDIEDVEVKRELASSLPGTVLGAGGITAAGGDVTWAQPEDVETRSRTPWAPEGALPPAGGSRAVVTMGDERGTCTLLTGRIDDAAGAFAGGALTSALVDDIDRLNQPVTLPPLINAMPPLVEGNPARYVGLSGVWVADRVLRMCGYYATPPAVSGTVVSATAMGSMWPEVGEVTACTDFDGTGFPQFVSTPWGAAAQGVNAYYAPIVARTLDSPIEAMVLWPGAAAGNFSVTVTFGSVSLRLATTAANVVAQTIASGTTTTVATAARGAATMAVLRATPSGASLLVELRTNAGASVSATITPPAGMLTTALSQVRVASANATAQVGAVKVGFPATAFADLAFTATTVFRLLAFSPHALVAQPAIINRNALDLLKEHAAAVCAAMWLDEQGRVQWVARDVLWRGDSVRTLTAKDDLLDAAWSDEWRDVYSRVVVKWSEVSVTRSSRDNVTLWEGSSGTVESGSLIADFASPPAGEDWIMVDTSITKVGPSSDLADYNYGRGSFTGATLSDGGTETWASTSLLNTGVRRIDWRTYGVFTDVGAVPTGKQASMQGPSEFGLGVWSSRFGQKLPVLRGRAKFELTDTQFYSDTRGPAEAAVYTHDAGWWVQYETQAQALADWIASTATIRTPNLRDVQVVFDPRLQLGDKVVIEDPARSGLRVTGVVFGLQQIVAQANAATRLSLRVLEVAIIHPTLRQYDTVWQGATLAQRDAQWSGKTLAAFDANPLRRD
jgi:hypothetical protein